MIEKASSKKLMLGTSLGETLTLDPLPAIAMDTEQREWSLRNIVDLSPDGLTNSRAMIGKVVPGLAVTISFQEEHILRWARCNSYEASLRIDGEATVIGPPSATAL